MAAINGVEIKYKDDDDERDDRFGESFSFSKHIKEMKWKGTFKIKKKFECFKIFLKIKFF